MVYNCVFWLNSFLNKKGIDATISPRAVMTGQIITYNKHCKLEFGTYVQIHEKHNNSMEPRTIGAIALRPSRNEQGGHYFLSLHTGNPEKQLDCIAHAKQRGGCHTQTSSSIKKSWGRNIHRQGWQYTNDKDETEEAAENEPIPVADDNYNEIIHKNNEEIINEQQENDTITGVHKNEQNDNTNDDDTPEHDPEDTYDYTQAIPEEEKNESDKYVTIGDIKIMSEINMRNRESEKAEDGETEIRTNERYNLQPRPKNRVQFALAQSDKQSIVLPKTHAHIKMT